MDECIQASIIICTFNNASVIKGCLQSLKAIRSPHPYEVIVVDNASTDESVMIIECEALSQTLTLIRSERNLGFAGGNNLGIQASNGQIIILLNPDTLVPETWLENILAPFGDHPKIGAVGCKLLYPFADSNGHQIIQHAGGIIHSNALTLHRGYGEPDKGQWDEPCECDYLTGAAIAIRRDALKQIGLLDPEFFPAYYEEADLCVRMAHAGWRIVYEPSASLIHLESQTQGVASRGFYYCYTRNRLRYLALHGSKLSKIAAIKAELKWFFNCPLKRWPTIFRAYLTGLGFWRIWRKDRAVRRTIPFLATHQGT